MGKGDEIGMFWEEVDLKQRSSYSKSAPVARTIPPPPDTGWVLPTEFPELRNCKAIAIDIETKDPDLLAKGPGTRTNGKIVGVAIGTAEGYRQYFPVDHEREIGRAHV